VYSKAFERKGGINLGFAQPYPLREVIGKQKGLQTRRRNSYVKFSYKQFYYKKNYTYNSNTINPAVLLYEVRGREALLYEVRGREALLYEVRGREALLYEVRGREARS